MASNTHIYFRVDEAHAIGSGHMMRCLTLAESLKVYSARQDLKSSIHFICAGISEQAKQRCIDNGFSIADFNESVHAFNRDTSLEALYKTPHEPHHDQFILDVSQDASQTIDVIQQELETAEHDMTIIVADHYSLTDVWYRQLNEVVDQLIIIDDLANRFYSCDMLIDQTFGRTAGEYENLCPAEARLFLGCQYALLRPQFSRLRDESLCKRQASYQAPQKNRSVLITLGNSDIHNTTLDVLEALSTVANASMIDVDIVIGAMHRERDRIVRYLDDNVFRSADIHVAVRDMATLMHDADLCISAGGSTLWECCTLALPTIAIITASNQRTIVNNLSKEQAIVSAGERENLQLSNFSPLLENVLWSPSVLMALSKTSQALCAGNGADLIAEAVLSSCREEVADA